MKTIVNAVTCLALLVAGANSALSAVVFPGDPAWGNPPGENSGGGSSAITTTAPRSGNGSLEMHGDRTRYFGLGNPYDSGSNLGLLSQVTSFSFDWSVALDSVGAGLGYTPALRLHIWDGNQRSELIWEGAYNGFNNANPAVKGTWYTTGNSDKFYQWISGGVGDTKIYNRSISDWSAAYSPNAHISGISVGVGSSPGSGYHAFADNVTLGLDGSSTTYNFEPVPEPSTYVAAALLLLPLGAMLKRKPKFVR